MKKKKLEIVLIFLFFCFKVCGQKDLIAELLKDMHGNYKTSITLLNNSKSDKYPIIELVKNVNDSTYYFLKVDDKKDTITRVGLTVGFAKMESYIGFYDNWNDTFRINKNQLITFKNPNPKLNIDTEFTKTKEIGSSIKNGAVFSVKINIVNGYTYYQKIIQAGKNSIIEKIETFTIDNNTIIQQYKVCDNLIEMASELRIVKLDLKTIQVISYEGQEQQSNKNVFYDFSLNKLNR